ncbi:MAG: hypothetical protein WA441_12930 [Methyloceanibacter sp.]
MSRSQIRSHKPEFERKAQGRRPGRNNSDIRPFIAIAEAAVVLSKALSRGHGDQDA